MKASINGEPRDLPSALTLAQLLRHLQLPENGIAVAKNDRVIARAAHDCEVVEEGDRIEIIKAVAGG